MGWRCEGVAAIELLESAPEEVHVQGPAVCGDELNALFVKLLNALFVTFKNRLQEPEVSRLLQGLRESFRIASEFATAALARS